MKKTPAWFESNRAMDVIGSCGVGGVTLLAVLLYLLLSMRVGNRGLHQEH
jgi:hypothetical protein